MSRYPASKKEKLIIIIIIYIYIYIKDLKPNASPPPTSPPPPPPHTHTHTYSTFGRTLRETAEYKRLVVFQQIDTVIPVFSIIFILVLFTSVAY